MAEYFFQSAFAGIRSDVAVVVIADFLGGFHAGKLQSVGIPFFIKTLVIGLGKNLVYLGGKLVRALWHKNDVAHAFGVDLKIKAGKRRGFCVVGNKDLCLTGGNGYAVKVAVLKLKESVRSPISTISQSAGSCSLQRSS